MSSALQRARSVCKHAGNFLNPATPGHGACDPLTCLSQGGSVVAKVGYVAFVLTARLRRQPGRGSGPPGEPVPLDDLDGKGGDVLDGVASVLRTLTTRPKPERRDSREHAYRYDSVDYTTSGHYVLCQGAAGPFGVHLRMIDVDIGDESRHDDRKAAMTDLRAMVLRAPGARVGLIICERRSQRMLKDALLHGVLRPVGKHYGVVFTMDAHVDPQAWEDYVKRGAVARVTRVYRPRRREDYVPETVDAGELQMTITGGMARNVAGRVVSALLAAMRHEEPDAVNISELEPPDGEDFAQQRTSVVLDDGPTGTRRTVVVEDGKLPQWVYATDGRMPEPLARTTWSDHARSLLGTYGVTLQEGWERAPAPRPIDGDIPVPLPGETTMPPDAIPMEVIRHGPDAVPAPPGRGGTGRGPLALPGGAGS